MYMYNTKLVFDADSGKYSYLPSYYAILVINQILEQSLLKWGDPT